MSKISRRTALGGLGAFAALPFLRPALARAQPTDHPKRFVCIASLNGMGYDEWLPPGGEHDFRLEGTTLEPLAPHRSKIIVVDGLANRAYWSSSGNMHRRGVATMLTGVQSYGGDGAENHGGISLDQFLANRVGANDPFPSLPFGVMSGSSIHGCMGARARGERVIPESDPRAAFDRIFSRLDTTETERQRIRERRESVLDVVAGELDRLRGRLGGEHRRRIEAHMDGIRAIETRLQETISDRCAAPTLGSVPNPDENDNAPETTRLQMEIMVAALACEQTRVATYMWQKATSRFLFNWIGIDRYDHHAISHYQGVDQATAEPLLRRIERWYAGEVSHLLTLMDRVELGDGTTLLDQSLVFWTNDVGHVRRHGAVKMPYVLAGSAGGHLRTGRLVKCPRAAPDPENDPQHPRPGDIAHNRLLISIAQAMGVDIEEFGDPQYCDGGALPNLT